MQAGVMLLAKLRGARKALQLCCTTVDSIGDLGWSCVPVWLAWCAQRSHCFPDQARGEVLALLDAAEAASRDDGAAPPGSFYVSASWLACVPVEPALDATPFVVLPPSVMQRHKATVAGGSWRTVYMPKAAEWTISFVLTS